MSEDKREADDPVSAEVFDRATGRIRGVLRDLGYRRSAVQAVVNAVDLFSRRPHFSEGGLRKLLHFFSDLQRVAPQRAPLQKRTLDQADVLKSLDALRLLLRILESDTDCLDLILTMPEQFSWTVTIDQTRTLSEKVRGCYHRGHPLLSDVFSDGNGRTRARSTVKFRGRCFLGDRTVATVRSAMQIVESSTNLDVVEALLDFPAQYPQIAELFGIVGIECCIATDRGSDCVPMLVARDQQVELHAFAQDSILGAQSLYLQAEP